MAAAAPNIPTGIPGLGAVLGNGTKESWYAQNTGRYVSELFGQVSPAKGASRYDVRIGGGYGKADVVREVA